MSGSEVTVSKSQGFPFKISQAAQLLESNGNVTITAINSAISAAVNLVELLKHKVKGIHQKNLFEKMPDSNKTRVVFKLSLKPFESSEQGYFQPPIPESEVQEKSLAELKKLPWEDKSNETNDATQTKERRPRGRGRRFGGEYRVGGREEGKDRYREERVEKNEEGKEHWQEGRRNRGGRRFRQYRGDRTQTEEGVKRYNREERNQGRTNEDRDRNTGRGRRFRRGNFRNSNSQGREEGRFTNRRPRGGRRAEKFTS